MTQSRWSAADQLQRSHVADLMTEEQAHCSSCGRSILQQTADRLGGMCAPCAKHARKTPEQLFEEAVFRRIDAAIEPFSSYRNAVDALRKLPPGYLLCFAFGCVHADLSNGGASQLYRNSTWPMIVDAIEAAEVTNMRAVASLLREIVYYYHNKNRSKLTSRVTEEFFASIPRGWQKSLAELDNEYLALSAQASTVIHDLCERHHALFEPMLEQPR